MREDTNNTDAPSSDEVSERNLWLNTFAQFAGRGSASEAAAEADEAVKCYRRAFGGGK